MVRRNPRRVHFVIIDRDVVRDTRLSWKARGLLAYLLSQDDNWEISLRQLVKASPGDKETSLRSAFKELVKTGYAKLVFTRNTENSRATGKRYVIDEAPHIPEQDSEVQETSTSEISDMQVFSSSEILNDRTDEVQKTCMIKKELETKKDLGTQEELETKETPSPLTPPPGGKQAKRGKTPKHGMPTEQEAQDALKVRIFNDAFRAWVAQHHPTFDAEAQWDYFVSQCLAKGYDYADFGHAFRNSFLWDNSPAQRGTKGPKNGTYGRHASVNLSDLPQHEAVAFLEGKRDL